MLVAVPAAAGNANRMSSTCRRCLILSEQIVLAFGRLALASVAIDAQTPVRIRHTIAAVDGNTLETQSHDGHDLKLHLAGFATIAIVRAARFEDIQQADYLASAAMRRPDGTFVSLEVHHLPPNGPPGHTRCDLQPGSTMTKAGVEANVQPAGNRELALAYTDGAQKILGIRSDRARCPAAALCFRRRCTPPLAGHGTRRVERRGQQSGPANPRRSSTVDRRRPNASMHPGCSRAMGETSSRISRARRHATPSGRGGRRSPPPRRSWSSYRRSCPRYPKARGRPASIRSECRAGSASRRIRGAGALRAEIRAPGAAPGPRGARERLTVPIRAGQAAKVRALSGSNAGDEECHVSLLRLNASGQAERQKRNRGNYGKARRVIHLSPPVVIRIHSGRCVRRVGASMGYDWHNLSYSPILLFSVALHAGSCPRAHLIGAWKPGCGRSAAHVGPWAAADPLASPKGTPLLEPTFSLSLCNSSGRPATIMPTEATLQSPARTAQIAGDRARSPV